MRKKPAPSPWIRFLFLIYMGMMLWLLFGRSRGWVEGLSYREMLELNTNVKPLYTIRNYLQVVIRRTNDTVFVHCLINLLGNVLLFIPAGWLLSANFKAQRKFSPFFLTCLGSVLLIESAQLFSLLGSFDVDDIILNMAGLLLGYGAYKLLKK